jgi:hypothetical protein
MEECRVWKRKHRHQITLGRKRLRTFPKKAWKGDLPEKCPSSPYGEMRGGFDESWFPPSNGLPGREWLPPCRDCGAMAPEAAPVQINMDFMRHRVQGNADHRPVLPLPALGLGIAPAIASSRTTWQQATEEPRT